MNQIDVVEISLRIEKAIEIFFSKDKNTESDFIDSCQLLVDSGIWPYINSIAETCIFLIHSGRILLPEVSQQLSDGTVLIGVNRKNLIN